MLHHKTQAAATVQISKYRPAAAPVAALGQNHRATAGPDALPGNRLAAADHHERTRFRTDRLCLEILARLGRRWAAAQQRDA
jgi:hypothetical protein